MLNLILSFFLLLLQFLLFSITKMENLKFDREANCCLANTLDEPCPSLAQKPAISLSLPHLRAVKVLQDQKDDDILAYIRLARSLHHHQNIQYSAGYDTLSADQVQAIWTLKDYPQVDRTWLKETRELGEIVEHLLDTRQLISTSMRLQKLHNLPK